MTNETFTARVNRDELRGQIQSKYTEVALEPEKGFHFHTGRPLARMLGYSEEDLSYLPDSAVESFAGTGHPRAVRALQPGETVLDVGSGAGFDTLLAARDVGPAGKVIAVDMTEAMLAKTQAGAESRGLTNVDARQGYAENLPVDDASVDVVISNGVINLTPDKVAVMRELSRVLKPNGHLQIADIVVGKQVPQSAKDDIDLWSSCIAGALLYSEWTEILDQLGFDVIEWGREVDVFSGSVHESGAADFETKGITFLATKRNG